MVHFFWPDGQFPKKTRHLGAMQHDLSILERKQIEQFVRFLLDEDALLPKGLWFGMGKVEEKERLG